MTTTAQPRIHPVIRYQDAHRALTWLEEAFGFQKQAVFEGPNGSVAHAEMSFGTGVIGFSSAQGVDPKNPWTLVREGIYVSLSDIDAHHDRAAAAGAEIARSLRDEDYGSRDYSARDLDGHLWGFGTYQMIKDDREQPFVVGLHYQDAKAALEWLSKAFGFQKTLEVPANDGRIFHAEMGLGGAPLFLDGGPKDEQIWGGHSQYVAVHVDDPDAHHARAAAAGAKVVTPLKTAEWGARGYCAQDFEGFIWNFSTYKPQGSGA